jgi:hypothetical protein
VIWLTEVRQSRTERQYAVLWLRPAVMAITKWSISEFRETTPPESEM